MILEPLLALFLRDPAMSLSENSRRNSLRPTFFYSPSTSRSPAMRNPSSPPPGAGSPPPRFIIQAPSEPSKIEMYSPAFYGVCTAGGIASCGITHMAVTPLDLVKCNMQKTARIYSILEGRKVLEDRWRDELKPSLSLLGSLYMCIIPAKYKSISSGFGILLKEQGPKDFFRGWVPTLFGYSVQGACKFGFYNSSRSTTQTLLNLSMLQSTKTLIYLAGLASAEVIADVALCPMEAVKVRVQTQPGFARGLCDVLPKFVKSEGVSQDCTRDLFLYRDVRFLI